jgi:hypothetical protein
MKNEFMTKKIAMGNQKVIVPLNKNKQTGPSAALRRYVLSAPARVYTKHINVCIVCCMCLHRRRRVVHNAFAAREQGEAARARSLYMKLVRHD